MVSTETYGKYSRKLRLVVVGPYCIHHTHWELSSWFSSHTWQLRPHSWVVHFVGLLWLLYLVWGRLFYMTDSESWSHLEWQVIWCSSCRMSEGMVECVAQCIVWNTSCKWYWVSLGSHLMPSSKLHCYKQKIKAIPLINMLHTNHTIDPHITV